MARVNVPTLIELASPDDDLEVGDLTDLDHPLNEKAISGKRKGMACMIGDDLYVALGSNPSSPWMKLDIAVDVLDRTRASYATMAITQRDKNDPDPHTMTLAAHPSGNSTLNPPAAPVVASEGPIGGYYKVGAYVLEGSNKEIDIVDSSIVIPNDGVFLAPVAYAHFRHQHTNSTVAFVFGIERDGMISFSQRPVGSKQANAENITNIGGGGQLTAQAGDIITVWVATDKAGIITLGNSNITVTMLEDTTGL